MAKWQVLFFHKEPKTEKDFICIGCEESKPMLALLESIKNVKVFSFDVNTSVGRAAMAYHGSGDLLFSPDHLNLFSKQTPITLILENGYFVCGLFGVPLTDDIFDMQYFLEGTT